MLIFSFYFRYVELEVLRMGLVIYGLIGFLGGLNIVKIWESLLVVRGENKSLIARIYFFSLEVLFFYNF